MITEIGHLSLILAASLSICAFFCLIYGWRYTDKRLVRGGIILSKATCALLIMSFLSLLVAFVFSDFSVLVVFLHSSKATPWLYKISALWSHHEGSILFWVLLLSSYSLFLLLSPLPLRVLALSLSIQNFMVGSFSLFVLLTSNPFKRLWPVALDGQDLNPLLQDASVVLHPPLLYSGYVGFSLVFSLALAILVERPASTQTWAKWLRPWALLAWGALTIGITLGSFWAYYELGWGGWWFWDPVENASLLPWLAGAALLHSLRVTTQTGSLQRWTLFLGLLCFSLSLFGMFLVRAGLLTSVHSFTNDPERGLFILCLIVLLLGCAFSLYSLAASSFRAPPLFSPFSQQGALAFNTFLFVLLASVVLLGTLYPLLVESLTSHKITVAAPYFNATVVPLFLPIIFILGVSLFLPSQSLDTALLKKYVLPASLISSSLFLGSFFFLTLTLTQLFAIFGLCCGIWLLLLSTIEWGNRLRKGGWRLLRNYGSSLAHLSLALFIIGISSDVAWREEEVFSLAPGSSKNFAGYDWKLIKVDKREGKNFIADSAVIEVYKQNTLYSTLIPEKRFYLPSKKTLTETAICFSLLEILYITLGDSSSSGRWTIRAYRHFGVGWIWVSGLLMAIGALILVVDSLFKPLFRKNKSVS